MDNEIPLFPMQDVSTMKNRQTLRDHMKVLRGKISYAMSLDRAVLASDCFGRSGLFSRCQHIACYKSISHEFKTDFIIQQIWEAGKTCYLPVLKTDSLGGLQFVKYERNTLLVENQYGIEEPVYNENTFILPQDLDLVLVPLLAFDVFGNRIGTGKGYYDRTFSFLLKTKDLQKPLLCGVAYAFQKVDQIEKESWDVPIHAVLTERGIEFFLNSSFNMC